jgi:hypothetical protein
MNSLVSSGHNICTCSDEDISIIWGGFIHDIQTLEKTQTLCINPKETWFHNGMHAYILTMYGNVGCREYFVSLDDVNSFLVHFVYMIMIPKLYTIMEVWRG